MADVPDLPRRHSAWHPQGRARRRAVRYLDLDDPRHRARGASVPRCRAAAGAVCGRFLRPMVPFARAGLRQLGPALRSRQGPRLRLASRAAADGDGARHLHDDRVPDQELVPGRNPQAIRHDRARQGPDRNQSALRPRLPQRHAARHLGLSGGLHRGLLFGLPVDRDHLLARRAWPVVIRIDREA